MCKVNLVSQARSENDINTVNVAGINECVNSAKELMCEEFAVDVVA